MKSVCQPIEISFVPHSFSKIYNLVNRGVKNIYFSMNFFLSSMTSLPMIEELNNRGCVLVVKGNFAVVKIVLELKAITKHRQLTTMHYVLYQ